MDAMFGKTVGVLGGGQLGRMMIYAAQRLGVQIKILDPSADAPASQIASRHLAGRYDDAEKILQLAEGCDVVTVEIEHVNTDGLAQLEAKGVRVEPSSSTVRLIQDKYEQKVFLSSRGVPVAEFVDAPTMEVVEEWGSKWGYPLLLKAKRMAYDGKGNYVVRSKEDIATGFAKLGNKNLYIERFVDFVCELAVMVARRQGDVDSNGQRVAEIKSYPVVETVHLDNICHMTFCPPRPSSLSLVESAALVEDVKARAEEVAMNAISNLSGAGIYGVELFLLRTGEVILNEIAPRPHNSGHYTIESSPCCQFEQHLRAVLNVPLGGTYLSVGAAGMMNVLGKGEGAEGHKLMMEEFNRAFELDKKELEVFGESARPSLGGASCHFYGKHEARKGRKMGHITVVAPSIELLERKMRFLESGTFDLPTSSSSSSSKPLVGIIMGSDSDLPTMRPAAEVLDKFGVPYELTVVSAHRTPHRMYEYATTAHKRGIKVIIAGAGGAAHLPGMVASLTCLPVVGVPVFTRTMNGYDSLLSIVQMPRGIPVATVAIDNGMNAGLLAVRMLAVCGEKSLKSSVTPSLPGSEEEFKLLKKVLDYSADMKEEVEGKAEMLSDIGYSAYMTAKGMK
eukprot:GILI01011924.1.p1 GENE.GILI01011924.1~~GILI01011924.1.p1  ORF type:complete len:654 (-),score=204.45 GILI01011924.1:140-2002(-)